MEPIFTQLLFIYFSPQSNGAAGWFGRGAHEFCETNYPIRLIHRPVSMGLEREKNSGGLWKPLIQKIVGNQAGLCVTTLLYESKRTFFLAVDVVAVLLDFVVHISSSPQNHSAKVPTTGNVCI